MLIPRFAENENVVQENHHKLTQVQEEDRVHKGLNGSWGISQAKPHYSELKVAKGCVDGCPRDVLILDSNLVVPSSQIKLCKVTTTLNRIEKVVYTWQASFFLDRDPILLPSVADHAQTAIRFLNKEYRCAVG